MVAHEFHGVAAGRAAWTPEEEETLRRLYPTGVDAAAAALPSRSRSAIMRRAQILEVYDGKHQRLRWTNGEDEKLALLWESGLPLARIATEMGRTAKGVYERACRLGFPVGVPEGYESFTSACERTGFHRRTLLMILSWANVRRRRTLSRPHDGKPSRWFVDPIDVDEAVEKWLSAETVKGAARARGVDDSTLRYWLRRAGLLKPSSPGSRKSHRIPTADIDRVVAGRMVTWKKRKAAVHRQMEAA